MSDLSLLVGSRGFQNLLVSLRRRDAVLHSVFPSDTGAPVFGKRQVRPVRTEDTLKIQRLSLLQQELDAVVGETGAHGAVLFRLVTAPIPLLKIGELATITIDPGTGLYSLREDGPATSLVITSSEERLLDHVMCLLAAGSNQHDPFTADLLVRLVLGQKLADVQRRMVIHTLRRFHGNRAQAAEALGLSLQELRDHIRGCLGDWCNEESV